MKFRFIVRLKPWNNRGEIERDVYRRNFVFTGTWNGQYVWDKVVAGLKIVVDKQRNDEDSVTYYSMQTTPYWLHNMNNNYATTS